MVSSDKIYTLDQVLNFSVQDLPEHHVIDIEGWCDLPPAKREECLRRLRELIRQRDETVRSAPVDPTTLEEKLNQLSSAPARSSSSPTSSIHTSPPDEEWLLEESIRIETESYYTLLDEDGIPSHPLDVTFAISNDPGEYEPTILFWQAFGSRCSDSIVFEKQLTEWRVFREYQRRIRQIYLPNGRFHSYQRKVRNLRFKHGHEDDVELLEDVDKQSKMQNWVEYQYMKYAGLQTCEQQIEKAEAGIVPARRALEDASLLGVEEHHDPRNFSHHLAMSSQQGDAENKAFFRVALRKRELALAVKRLEAAQSERSEEKVGRLAWMKLVQEHLNSAQVRLQKVKAANTFAGNYLTAENDAKVAETAFDADRSTWIGNTVVRAVLVVRLQEEVQSAERRLKEAEQSEREIELKGKLLDFLHAYAQRKQKLEQHQKLVDWVEQQRQELVRASTVPDPSMRHPRDQNSPERLRCSNAQRHLSPSKSMLDKSSRSRRRKTKGPDAAAILSPRDGSKISKRSRKRP